jgi:hypothetical protein
MAVNKVVYGTTVLIDLTDDTVTTGALLQGYTAHDRSGRAIVGTMTAGAAALSDTVTTLPNGGLQHDITAIDLTQDTVTSAHLEAGYTAHDARGNAITGTATIPSTPWGRITYNGGVITVY